MWKNWVSALAFARATLGYKGDASLKSLLEYIDSEKLEGSVVDRSGKPVDLKSEFTKAASSKIVVEYEEDDATAHSAVPVKGAASGDSDASGRKAAKINSGSDSSAGIDFAKMKSDARRKQYDESAKIGRCVYPSSDIAEAATAAFRLKMADVYRLPDSVYTQRAQDEAVAGKAGSTLVNSLGGALVSDYFNNSSVLYMTEEYGVARKIANVVNMSGGDTIFSRRTGVVTMTPTNQNVTPTAQDPSYGNVTLNAVEYMVLIKTARQMFRDAAINVADDFAKNIIEAQLIAEDSAYFLADGSATYGGQSGLILALPSGAYLSTASAWSGVTLAHLESAPGSVQNVNPSRQSWVMSRQAFWSIALRLAWGTTKGSMGPDSSVATLSGATNGANGMLLGFPVYFSQVLPSATASATTFAYFGDFTGASMLGDKQNLEIMSSTEAGFAANQIWTRGTSSFCVKYHGDGRGTTYGPVVALKTT